MSNGELLTEVAGPPVNFVLKIHDIDRRWLAYFLCLGYSTFLRDNRPFLWSPILCSVPPWSLKLFGHSVCVSWPALHPYVPINLPKLIPLVRSRSWGIASSAPSRWVKFQFRLS